MKPTLHRQRTTARLATRRGSVLIVVLWIAIGMVGMALYFADSMRMELRAADNRAAGIAADQAIEGAARYVSYILSNYSTNGVMPGLPTDLCAGVPIGGITMPLSAGGAAGAPTRASWPGRGAAGSAGGSSMGGGVQTLRSGMVSISNTR